MIIRPKFYFLETTYNCFASAPNKSFLSNFLCIETNQSCPPTEKCPQRTCQDTLENKKSFGKAQF